MIEKESRLLRIGVVGAGPIAQAAHFESCRRARNAELYAICDVAEDLLSKMSVIHQPRVTYTDYERMLADPAIEAIIVATADQYHGSMTLMALAAGKHVLVEKPLAVSIEECQTLETAVYDSGRVLQIGTMKRFDPAIAFAHDFIQAEIGQILALKAWYCDSTYRYIETDNLQPIPVTSDQIRRPAGNPKADKKRYYLLGHASHLVDTARFLGGEIVRVQTRLVEKFGAYCWFVAVEFANGAVGHLDLTFAVRMEWHEGFQIYGEYGSVIGKTYNPWYLRSSDVECFSSRDGQYHRPHGADGHVYRRQVEGFADTILNGTPLHGAGIEDGVAAIRTLVAISRSAETGEWVSIADVSGGV